MAKHSTADGVEYTPSNQELYLKSLAENDGAFVPGEAGQDRSFVVEGNDTSAYVGVSPEYANYANETEKPHRAADGPEAAAEAKIIDGDMSATDPTPEPEAEPEPEPEPTPEGSAAKE